MRRLIWLSAVWLCILLILPASAQSAPEDQVKELNFVFLHGAGGTACSLQRLADRIVAQLPPFIADYEKANPGIKVRFNTLNRCYPNDVDIETWAKNIADSINKYTSKKNLILIGHSMGGKTALFATAHNVGNITDNVPLVVTINSPIKSFNRYYFTGGVDYWRALWLLPEDQGVINSIAYYDSSEDGKWVGATRRWLAFVSGESAPVSSKFDVSGLDPLPRDIDDTIVPVSAQYSEGADVVWYGEYAHSQFNESDELAGYIADKILRYIFGGGVDCSVFGLAGTFEHTANWLPMTNSWEDVVGELPGNSGSVVHRNESYFKWQEWEDVVGFNDGRRSSYQARQESLPVLTGISELRWLSPDNPQDSRLYLRTRAAPGTTVQVEWSIAQQTLLPPNLVRDRYEVEITTGTPFTRIEEVSWLADDPRDLRLTTSSKAEGPFRWFKAQWRTYFKEKRDRKVIEQIQP